MERIEMSENDSKKLLESINGLKVEMAGFRAEMREFKKTITAQVDTIGLKQTACQINPSSCSNGRRLEEHIKADSGKLGKITGVTACVISVLSFLFVLIEKAR